MDQVAAQLGLDEKTKSAIQSDARQLFSSMRSQFQNGGDSTDRDQLRAQMRAQLAAIYKKYLDDAQYSQFEQIQRQSAETRSVQIWKQTDGEIIPVMVRVGIGDDTHTQVISKNMSEGDVVVTRMRSPRP